MQDTDIASIKEVLRRGNASDSTIVLLQSFLQTGSIPSTAKVTVPGGTARGNGSSQSKGKRTLGKTQARKAEVVVIHEDEHAVLSTRQRYTLATEIVNICLKVLDDSAKRINAEKSTSPLSPLDGRRTRSQDGDPAERALQSCVGNSMPSLPESKSERTAKSSSGMVVTCEHGLDCAHVGRIAQCALHAFSYLHSIDAQDDRAAKLPRWQTESGLLSLAGLLSAHGMDRMVLKALVLVKRRLEAHFVLPAPTKTKRQPVQERTPPANGSLATLLRLDCLPICGADALGVAISYHSRILKILVSQSRPATVEEAAQYLDESVPNAALNLIVRQMGETGDRCKAAKQLDQLSKTLLGLCPSTNPVNDHVALDAARSPSPQVAFQLQTTALKIRQLWWSIAQHVPNISRELMEPFADYAAAFVRRSSELRDSGTLYESVMSSFNLLSLRSYGAKPGPGSYFNVCDLLCVTASESQRIGEARDWLKAMAEVSSCLEKTHALRLVAALRELLFNLKHSSSSIGLRPMVQILAGDVSGDRYELDILLKTLSETTRAIVASETNIDRKSVVQLSSMAATLALRLTRTMSSRSLEYVQRIITDALQLCKTTDVLLTWLTPAAAMVFMRRGVLTNIASQAGSIPLSSAWSHCTDAVSLSNIIRGLMLMRLRSGSNERSLVFLDDETLSSNERGTLLEWQLIFLLDLAEKRKYRDAVREDLPAILSRLSEIYETQRFPIRRARVATCVLRLCGTRFRTVSPALFDPWLDARLEINSDLGEDVELRSFFEDIKASLTCSQLFTEKRPCVQDLKPSLLIWEQLCSESDVDLRRKIYDPNIMAQQLESIAAYFAMLGEDEVCLKTKAILVRLTEYIGGDCDAFCHALSGLARQHLQLGYAEQAKNMLSRAVSFLVKDNTSCLARLDYHVASAECSIAVDNAERCRISLDRAEEERSGCVQGSMSDKQRDWYSVLHARAWLARSACSLDSGTPHEALAAAKEASRIVNTLWSGIENPEAAHTNAQEVEESDVADLAIETLNRGVSRLKLKPKSESPHRKLDERAKGGAAYWSLVPILCRSLLHLSDMYTHHGVFEDASFYSEKAIELAESVGSTLLLSRARSHRSSLLLLAGRGPDADLCLARDEKTAFPHASLTLVERYCALASVCGEENAREAELLYEKAETVIACIMKKDLISGEELVTEEIDALGSASKSISLKRTSTQDGSTAPARGKSVRKSGKAISSNSRQKVDSNRSRAKPKPKPKEEAQSDISSGNLRPYMLEKIRAKIMVLKAVTQAHNATSMRETLSNVEQSSTAVRDTAGYSHARYQELMRSAIDSLQNDVVLNVLRDSTLCIPALKPSDLPEAAQSQRRPQTSSVAHMPKTSIRSGVKASKTIPFAQSDLTGPLTSARQLLLKMQRTKVGSVGTADVHKTCAMLLKAGSLLSSVSKPSPISELNSQSEGMVIDYARCNALRFGRYAASMDICPGPHRELAWPTYNSNCDIAQSISSSEFQRDFVDIIPKSWAAISLCLNEDASELYIARYDSGKVPLVLRLPFSRHKPDGLEEEVFDFYSGKAELQEIIDLSNYSCHNPGNLGGQAMKSKWWSEREALDRRMGELLVNIENIWFGGFKGVFAQQRNNADNLSKFRKTFEDVLDRHLPSRQASKRQKKALALSDGVFNLFIGLGHDHDGSVDLDEPLSDLLYFVVDMLQFSGEHNAYDEIEFDSMAVDVLDALRAYHESFASSRDESRHLVLVLDRRLQAFPWESLPCMETLNVSRVGSMTTLRERILAQRASHSQKSMVGDDGAAVVAPKGTYILNPSSDLQRTQTALQPTLSRLNTQWNAIVAREPDEAQFASAITDSSILLYFGHGAGSQYVRQRKIRRLPKCCNVAWLMGCSSGAVVEHGDLEPSAVPFAYLDAGTAEDEKAADPANSLCQAVVATLWDVTDKDIDRFSLRLGEEWGLWPSSDESKPSLKSPRKRQPAAFPSTPQRAPKTPKTPKVVKSPVPFKTPARDREGSARSADCHVSLVEALSRSREACYLRYLNGAAPVVYGVPVYLDK